MRSMAYQIIGNGGVSVAVPANVIAALIVGIAVYRAAYAISSVGFQINATAVRSILYRINENVGWSVVAHTNVITALRMGMTVYRTVCDAKSVDY